jgi:hypothetical protein
MHGQIDMRTFARGAGSPRARMSPSARRPHHEPRRPRHREHDRQRRAGQLATISTPWTSYAEAEAFKNAYLSLLPLLHFTYSAINPVAVKSLMKALGLPAGDLRKPLTNLEGEALANGLRIVAELGLDKRYGYKLKPLSAVAA